MSDILSAFIRSHLVTQHSTVSKTHVAVACSISTQSDPGKHVCLPLLLTASHYLLHISFENVLTNTASTTNSKSRGGEDSGFASTVFVFRLLLSVVTKLTKRNISMRSIVFKTTLPPTRRKVQSC